MTRIVIALMLAPALFAAVVYAKSLDEAQEGEPLLVAEEYLVGTLDADGESVPGLLVADAEKPLSDQQIKALGAALLFSLEWSRR